LTVLIEKKSLIVKWVSWIPKRRKRRKKSFIGSASGVDPTKLFFLCFFSFGVKLGHFTINNFFLYVTKTQAYQRKTEKFFVSVRYQILFLFIFWFAALAKDWMLVICKKMQKKENDFKTYSQISWVCINSI